MKQYLLPLHFSIGVKDIDESITWYKKHLDFHLVFKMYIEAQRVHLAFVRHGQFEIELIQHDEAISLLIKRPDPHNDREIIGAKHFAFLVEDVDSIYNRLKSEDVEVLFEPVIKENKEEGVREKIFFIRDINGVKLEFVQRL